MSDEKVIVSFEADTKEVDKALDKVAKGAEVVGSKTDSVGKSSFSFIKKGAEDAKGSIGGIVSEAEKLPGPLGDVATSVSSIGQKFLQVASSPVGIFAGAVIAAAASTKLAFDSALGGEEINAIGKRFDELALRFGALPEQLRSSFAESSKGLLDMEDIMKGTRQSFLELGTLSNQLPQLFQVATNIARTQGGSAIDIVGDLSRAIATGSTRVLRDAGLFIDAKDASEAYAKSLGKTANELTETEKKQAILNAALEQASKKFGDNVQSVTPMADSIKRLGVSAGEVFDTFKLRASEVFGPFFINLLNGAADSLDRFNKTFALVLNGGDVAKLPIEDQIDRVRTKLQLAQESDFKIAIDFWNKDQAFATVGQLSSELERLNAVKQALEQESQQRQAGLNADNVISLDAERRKKAQELADQAAQEQASKEQALAAQRESLLASSEQRLFEIRRQNFEQSVKLREEAQNTEEQLATDFFQRAEFAEQDHQLRLDAMRKQFGDLGLLNSQVYNQLQEAEEARHSLAIDQIETASQAKSLDDKKQYSGLIDAITGYTKAKLEGNATAAKNAFEQVGKFAKMALATQAVSAVAAFGESLTNSNKSMKDFLKSFLGMIGDMCVQLGTMLVLQGLGFNVHPLMPGSGVGLVAAGTALAFFGGVLKGLSGSGGGASASAASGGGATPTQLNSETSTRSTVGFEEQQRREPETKVALNVYGSIYDSEETGGKIIQLINEAFDKKGVQINQGAVA